MKIELHNNPLITLINFLLWICGLCMSAMVSFIDVTRLTQLAELIKAVIAIGGTICTCTIMYIANKHKVDVWVKNLFK